MANFLIITIFLIGALSSVIAIKISSKLDFDSEEPSSDSTSTYPDPLAIGEKSDNSSSQRDSRDVKIRFSVKPFLTPIFGAAPKKNPRNAPPQPLAVKYVYIDVTEEGITISGPGRVDCREKVCTMLVTYCDNAGNVIGAVQLTVVAKMPRFKINDVPVVDGVRGTGYGRSPPLGSNGARGPNHPNYIVYKIPQTPSFYRQTTRYNHPWPAQGTFNNGGWRPIAAASPVDDKIEAPLSQTNSEDQGPI